MLKLCSGGNGVDPDADLCYDDLDFHRSWKRDGYHGSITGFACEAIIYYFGKGCALFCVVVCQSDNNSLTFGLCAGCSGSRKFVLVDNRLFVVYLRILGVGFIDFISHAYTGSAMLVSGLMLMMPTMLLSGMIFPIESMPFQFQCFEDLLHTRPVLLPNESKWRQQSYSLNVVK